eukprot:EG_transcript_35164
MPSVAQLPPWTAAIAPVPRDAPTCLACRKALRPSPCGASHPRGLSAVETPGHGPAPAWLAVAGLLVPLLLLRWWCGPWQRWWPADLSTSVLPTWNAGAVAGDGKPPSVRRRKTTSQLPTDVQAALAVVLPRSGWRVVQAIRQRHDRGYERWMPHINLLF